LYGAEAFRSCLVVFEIPILTLFSLSLNPKPLRHRLFARCPSARGKRQCSGFG
jgi:hypothetical protein